MSEESKNFPKCGAPIPENAPDGLCPKCLLLGANMDTEPGYTSTMRLPKPAPPSVAQLSAAFPQLETEKGRQRLRVYYRGYARMAVEAGCGFVFEAPTWRAQPVWGDQMGYGSADLDRVNREAIAFMSDLRDEFGGARAFAQEELLPGIMEANRNET